MKKQGNQTTEYTEKIALCTPENFIAINVIYNNLLQFY
jgi:hypothetical protein